MKVDTSKIELGSIDFISDLSAFDCGDKDLNAFLKEDALKYDRELLSTTYLFFYRNKVIAFCSLSADSVNLDEEEREKFRQKGIIIGDYPALKIGRLAVGNNYQKSGVGGFIIDLIVGKSLRLSKDIGCRLVTVDAYPQAIEFYEKLGFKPIKRYKRRNAVMYLDILSVANNVQ